MVGNDSKKMLKILPKFSCEKCDYCTNKKSSYDKHILSVKHSKSINDSEKLPKVAHYECECGKIYKFDSGYYRHKKKCNNNTKVNDETSNKELITFLMKENTQLD